MPSLTLTNSPKKESVVVGKPPKIGIPPDLQSALELLFFLEEQRTGKVAPTPAWFLAEAFAAQQYRNFKATDALQHFLQGLLGSAYAGSAAMETYYATVVFALCMKDLYSGDTSIFRRCEWCLGQWGIREGRKDVIDITEAWVKCTNAKAKTSTTSNAPHETGNPNIVYERGRILLEVMQKRGSKLVKKVQSILGSR
jgi:hypothetical protein